MESIESGNRHVDTSVSQFSWNSKLIFNNSAKKIQWRKDSFLTKKLCWNKEGR